MPEGSGTLWRIRRTAGRAGQRPPRPTGYPRTGGACSSPPAASAPPRPRSAPRGVATTNRARVRRRRQRPTRRVYRARRSPRRPRVQARAVLSWASDVVVCPFSSVPVRRAAGAAGVGRWPVPGSPCRPGVAGAVAGPVPGLFVVVERDGAAEVGAPSGQRGQMPVGVAAYRGQVPADGAHGRLARGQIARGGGESRTEPVADEVFGHDGVVADEPSRGGAQRGTGRVV
jgi:hypothetical protein